MIATHAGYRFGEQEYMLAPSTVCRSPTAAASSAWSSPGTPSRVRRRRESRVIPAKRRWWSAAISTRSEPPAPENSNAHVAIGSDLDGFIKPTVAGIETASDLAMLEAPLRQAYGADAEAILSGNAMRVARAALG